MMRVLIIGASKGIGLKTTRQALEAGHHVRALARSATGMVLSDPNLEKIRGDALQTQEVQAALIGVDVVIQTLGVGLGDLFRPVHLFSDATRVLIAAMRTQAVKRLICVTGFGAGDSRESISCLQRQSTNPVSEPAFTYREAQTARARVMLAGVNSSGWLGPPTARGARTGPGCSAPPASDRRRGILRDRPIVWRRGPCPGDCGSGWARRAGTDHTP